jgi:hypothetical protein
MKDIVNRYSRYIDPDVLQIAVTDYINSANAYADTNNSKARAALGNEIQFNYLLNRMKNTSYSIYKAFKEGILEDEKGKYIAMIIWDCISLTDFVKVFDQSYTNEFVNLVSKYMKFSEYKEPEEDEIANLVATEATTATKFYETKNRMANMYKRYEEKEEQVDNQITKICDDIKKKLLGDPRDEIVEGKKFSVVGILKSLLATVAIFSVGLFGGLGGNTFFVFHKGAPFIILSIPLLVKSLTYFIVKR